MSDKDMIIRGCEYWIKNHKGEQLILEYTAVEDLLAVLKEQEELLHKKEKDIDKLCVEISRLKHQIHDNEPTFDDWTKDE